MNDNPSEMSNEDLEKDMNARNEADNTTHGSGGSNQPVEPTDILLSQEGTMDLGVDYLADKEQDMDDLVHEQSKMKPSGTIPDPEELKFRESQ